MPIYIVKCRGHYAEWSTIVDALITKFMTLDDFKKYYADRYGLDGINPNSSFLERIARADGPTGCSALDGETWKSMVAFNRCGPNETRLTEDEMWAKYGPHTKESDTTADATVPDDKEAEIRRIAEEDRAERIHLRHSALDALLREVDAHDIGVPLRLSFTQQGGGKWPLWYFPHTLLSFGYFPSEYSEDVGYIPPEHVKRQADAITVRYDAAPRLAAIVRLLLEDAKHVREMITNLCAHTCEGREVYSKNLRHASNCFSTEFDGDIFERIENIAKGESNGT